MLRNAPLVLIAGALVGCSGGRNLQPVDLSAPASASASVTMECVTRELDNLGYEITPESRATANTVTGVRINERPWYLRLLYGNTADQITATINNGRLQVTAMSSDPEGIGRDRDANTVASEAATLNAEEIIETCGRGG